MTSFERKFRRNQQKKAFNNKAFNDMDAMQAMLDIQVGKCTTCRESRVKLSYEELPEEIKQKFAKFNNEAEYYLHCKKCDEYSFIMKESEIDDLDIEEEENCKTCQTELEILFYDELPEEQRLKYADINTGVEYYIHCEKCNEYRPAM